MDTHPSIETVWLSQFAHGQLSAAELRRHWRQKVPLIFCPEVHCNCLRLSFDEDLAQKLLFGPLENFISDGDLDVIQKLKDLDNPSSLCGRVFKNGEPSYGCRDCGMDPTCVLCAACFKMSAHKNHRYKISTSAGGGYCDCGDKEAWKSDPFCQFHIKGELAGPRSGNFLDRVPSDLIRRIEFVFETILLYAHELLSASNASLPVDLIFQEEELNDNGEPKPSRFQDVYVTMLYNDELHTYDQVINALEKAIECSNRDAVAIATIIDREGRSLVKCSSYNRCLTAKSIMIKPNQNTPNKPLKVHVLHAPVVAHQIFASRLLTWLHKILEQAQTFRLIFSSIACKDNFNLIESIFATDTQMWKSSRVQWHRLFITGMLMDIESKKQFARVFTKYYSKTMKDFIQDDHEHSVCIISLGVQLFTMPTIAHMLIAEEDVLPRLITTFLSECNKNLRNSKLSLDSRGKNLASFNRVQYILYDLKYLVGTKPELWTSELRKGFLHGFDKLLCLLSIMEGMDPHVRQVGQHMEFEAIWENAFNFHIKLSNILPSIIEWAASDRTVFIKAFRLVLRKLSEITPEPNKRRCVKDFHGLSVSCIEYDVLFSPVSLHLPLSRLAAALMLHLDQYDLHYNSNEFNIADKPIPEELMEPALSLQVMIAQVHARLWKRNGFSLTSQLYFYHNVRCRQEMRDRDITLLQEAAALIDPNEFLIHVLNRHNLLQWAQGLFDGRNKSSTDDTVVQTTIVAEEFLLLLLAIISERYTVNIGMVSSEDCIRKEIIQLLCLESMPHSVLSRSLPMNANFETEMEKVVEDVAVFKKSSSSGDAKALFELKEEFRKEYNPFFYHYTKEEQSKSEVTQREKHKGETADFCCPPPVPPPFTKPFESIVNLLQCDVFMRVIQLILRKFNDPADGSVTEVMLQVTLHLIGCGLHEELRFANDPSSTYHFCTKAKEFNILKHLENLVNKKQTKPQASLLKWTIEKYNSASRSSPCDAKPGEDPSKKVSASAVTPSEENLSQKAAAAFRRRQIMESMAKRQNKFITKNQSLFEDSQPSVEMVDDSPIDITESPFQDLIALGPNQTPTTSSEPKYTCILCHQESVLKWNDSESNSQSSVMVVGAHVQRSTVLSRDRSQIQHIEEPDNFDTLIMTPDLTWGIHTMSCGHAMHAQCWQTYFDDVLLKERRKPLRYRNQNISFDIEKNEFLCPMCECLCNTALPLLPPLPKSSASVHAPDFEGWVQNLMEFTKMKESIIVDPSVDKEGTSSDKDKPQRYALISSNPRSKSTITMPSYKLLRMPPLEQIEESNSNLKSICESYANEPFQVSRRTLDMVTGFGDAAYHLGLSVKPDSYNSRILQVVFATTSYTIRSLEEAQRACNKALLSSVPDRRRASVQTLVKYASLAPACSYFQMSESTSLRLLSMVLGETAEDGRCLLQWDSFHLLVSLCLTKPGMIPGNRSIATGCVQDLHVLRLCLFSHVAQILLTIDESLFAEEMEVDDQTEGDSDFSSDNTVRDGEYLVALMQVMRNALGLSTTQVNPTKIFSYVRDQCLPFLRCCGVFFHCLSSVKEPEELVSSVWVPESEFFCLLRYLGLQSHFSQIFESSALQYLLRTWCQHPNLKSTYEKMRNRDWTSTNKLVSLPSDYSELIDTSSRYPCPASISDDSHTPTMCLVCGVVLCSQSYCCRTEISDGSVKRQCGACTYHAHYCGGGTGIFLRVRECRILFLSGKIKGCYASPPFLDEYGETDQGLRRGNPLHLNEEAYDRLYRKWISHSIPDDIARNIGRSNNLNITEWVYF